MMDTITLVFFAFLPASVNASSILAADFNADGKLDIFVGGASKNGEYPCASNSLLFINKGNSVFKNGSPEIFKNLRIVRGSKDADINHDGVDDLITAEDFGPIRITYFFKNSIPKQEIISPVGVWKKNLLQDNYGDDQLDIVSGNEGLNNQLAKVSGGTGIRLLGGKFSANGQITPVLAGGRY